METIKTHAVKLLAIAVIINLVLTVYALYAIQQHTRALQDIIVAMSEYKNAFIQSGIVEFGQNGTPVINRVFTQNGIQQQ